MIYVFSENEFKKAVLTKNRFGLTCVSLGSFWVKTRDVKKLREGSAPIKNEKGAIVIAHKKRSVTIIYKGNDELSHNGWGFFSVNPGEKFKMNDQIYTIDDKLNVVKVG